MADERGVYTIGIVARITGMHEQTIRQYEKLGLIDPERSPGGTRLFSEKDLERLKSIHSLTREMGVNLAGVEIILRMRERHDRLLRLAREMFSHMDEDARHRFDMMMRGDEPGLVPAPRQDIAVRGEKASKRRIEVQGEDE